MKVFKWDRTTSHFVKLTQLLSHNDRKVYMCHMNVMSHLVSYFQALGTYIRIKQVVNVIQNLNGGKVVLLVGII